MLAKPYTSHRIERGGVSRYGVLMADTAAILLENLDAFTVFARAQLDDGELARDAVQESLLKAVIIAVASSVVFVKAGAFDVVPGGRLMAQETLVHLGLLHARDDPRNHFEVHHVVAWRGLMALRARLRGG